MVARGASRSGHWPDGPDSGEARPAWGAVPDCDTGNLSQDSGAFLDPYLEGIARRLDFTRVEAGNISRFAGMTKAEHLVDRDRKRSLERLVENAVGASIDISPRDLVKTDLSAGDLPIPDTYRDLMPQAGTAGFTEAELAEGLAEMARLRHILAHQYLGISISAGRSCAPSSTKPPRL